MRQVGQRLRYSYEDAGTAWAIPKCVDRIGEMATIIERRSTRPAREPDGEHDPVFLIRFDDGAEITCFASDLPLD